MDQLISKYRQLQRVEKALHQKMLSRSNRLKAFREGESFDDESRELSLENDYERSRDHLGDLHGKLNLLKTELARRLRWKYEVMIHEIESGPQSAATVAEIMRLTNRMRQADKEAEKLLS